MRSRLKIIIGVLALMVVIQAFRPKRNSDTQVLATDITRVLRVPDNVHAVLKKACYDCHSNNTDYPWYANIQPVGWFLANHIKDGKRHLNFSEFGSYSPAKQQKKLIEISEEVDSGEMPLWSYTAIHSDARLSAEEKALISRWGDSLSNK